MTVTIGDVMTAHVYTIGDDQTLESAKQTMYRHGIRHLPVLHGGKCVGILSDRDVKLAYAVEHERAAALPVSDACTAEVYSVGISEPLASVVRYMHSNAIGCAVVADDDRVLGIFTVIDACRVLEKYL